VGLFDVFDRYFGYYFLHAGSGILSRLGIRVNKKDAAKLVVSRDGRSGVRRRPDAGHTSFALGSKLILAKGCD
jgi:hypothetical protein